jgi:hypothetical protein
MCSCITDIPQQEHIVPDDEDVLEEENIVKNDAKDGTVNPDIAVQIRGLGKMYPGATHIGCFKCKKTSPYHAVRVSNSLPAYGYHAGLRGQKKSPSFSSFLFRY